MFDLVVTYHNDAPEPVAGLPVSEREVITGFPHVHPKARDIIGHGEDWKLWVLCDRDPVENWIDGRVTLVGDAAQFDHVGQIRLGMVRYPGLAVWQHGPGCRLTPGRSGGAAVTSGVFAGKFRMTYAVKEIFLMQQGEGANIGRTAVFIRFSGCNLWSGRESDREKAACQFCDTDFVGGRRMGEADIADQAAVLWPGQVHRFCVLTGGEPLLQADKRVLIELRSRDFSVAVETNGTRPLPCDIDWVCVSPKAGAPLVLQDADELKLVYPQAGMMPEDLAAFRSRYRWLSPTDLPGRRTANTEAAAAYCRANAAWRLAIQAHKYWMIP